MIIPHPILTESNGKTSVTSKGLLSWTPVKDSKYITPNGNQQMKKANTITKFSLCRYCSNRGCWVVTDTACDVFDLYNMFMNRMYIFVWYTCYSIILRIENIIFKEIKFKELPYSVYKWRKNLLWPSRWLGLHLLLHKHTTQNQPHKDCFQTKLANSCKKKVLLYLPCLMKRFIQLLRSDFGISK